MERESENLGGELAVWLKDSAARDAAEQEPETPEALLQLIERVAGCRLRSQQDIAIYFERRKAQEEERRRAENARRTVRERVLLVLLLLSAGQYYYWDVSLQIASIQKVHYFGAPANAGQRSATASLATT